VVETGLDGALMGEVLSGGKDMAFSPPDRKVALLSEGSVGRVLAIWRETGADAQENFGVSPRGASFIFRGFHSNLSGKPKRETC